MGKWRFYKSKYSCATEVIAKHSTGFILQKSKTKMAVQVFNFRAPRISFSYFSTISFRSGLLNPLYKLVQLI